MSFHIQKKYDRDTAYWNDFYAGAGHRIKEPSLFAKYVLDHWMDGRQTVLDLGCGNGRDSLFFAAQGLHVTGVDASETAVLECRKKDVWETKFICGDFVSDKEIYSSSYDVCYSRFSMHAINELQEKALLVNVFRCLNPEGAFCIEVRGTCDDLYGKGEPVGENSFLYQGHYRRFIEFDQLKRRLVAAGFSIEYAEESHGFAPFGESDPKVIRIVATKKSGGQECER